MFFGPTTQETFTQVRSASSQNHPENEVIQNE